VTGIENLCQRSLIISGGAAVDVVPSRHAPEDVYPGAAERGVRLVAAVACLVCRLFLGTAGAAWPVRSGHQRCGEVGDGACGVFQEIAR